jgi:hypothetical protein
MTSTVAVQRALAKSDLPPLARLVAHALIARADFKTGVVPDEHTPSLRELEVDTGLARSSVAKFLDVLEAYGWVERDRPEVARARAEGAKTIYRVKIGGSPHDEPPVVRHTDQGSSPHGPGVVRDTDQTWSATRTTGSPSHGLNIGRDLKVSTVTSPSTSHSQARKARKAAPDGTRGTRIPDDFHVTADMVAWARETAPDVDGRRETEKFIDYWRAKPGAAGRKLDWVATWRVWLRTEQDRTERGRARASPATTRHVDNLTSEQRAARNPFIAAVSSSSITKGAS